MTVLFATSDARLLHFRDPRPPHLIQFEIEREHMVLLQRAMLGSLLIMHAQSRINGAPYRLLLKLEAVLADVNCYSLLIEIDWKTLPASTHEYHRKSAPGWLDVWLRNYSPENPAPVHGSFAERYDALVRQALAAEAAFVDVLALQRAILDGLRRGGTYATAHKEGGTRIFFQNGRFVRADHGDHEARQEYVDETAFLTSLRHFYDWQTSRSVYPDKVDDYTAWKLILRLQDVAQSGPRAPAKDLPRSGGDAAMQARKPGRSAKLAMLVAGIGIAGALTLGVLSHAFTVKTIGHPTDQAATSTEEIVLLLVTQEPYVPSLHRDPSKDRFRLSLLVHARDGSGKKRHLPIVGGLDASQSKHAARMLGFDGKLFWFLAGDITAYDPAAGALIRLDDLRRANPALQALWTTGHYELIDRLVVSTRDNRIFVEVDPHTLVARPLASRPLRKRMFAPNPVTSMLVSAPARGDDTFDAAYVRAHVDAPPLRLTQPESRLLIYWRKSTPLQRMHYIARVDGAGKTIWETQTGIGDLQQVLPDPDALALIGTRPRVPDKVPEPVLAIIRTDTGSVTLHSLWIGQ